MIENDMTVMKGDKTNIISIFIDRVNDHKDEVALIAEGREVTYAELGILVDQCATRYATKGISKGTKVMVLIPISIDLYVNVLALFKLGAVVIFTDEWSDKARISICVEVVGIDLLITNTRGYMYSFVHGGLRQIKRKILYKNSSKVDQISVQCASQDSALVTFTTGSTGIPKAANRTHGFLVSQYEELSHLLAPLHDEVCMTTLPIVALCCIGMGIRTVLPNYNHQKPEETNLQKLELQLANHKVSAVIGSPFLVHHLCNFAREEKDRLKHIFVGGAAVFQDDALSWEQNFPNATTTIIYGSTEAEPIAEICTSNMVTQQNMHRGEGICVGRPTANISVKIISIVDGPIASMDHCEILQNAQIGEIIVSGNHVLGSYINSPEALKENKISDNGALWHRTGDAGYMYDGYLYLVGRTSHMISINGCTQGVFAIEEELRTISDVHNGTMMNVNGKQVIVIDGNLSQESTQQIKSLYLNVEIITNFSIPMDPRHHSKIDYEKLRSMIYA